MDLLRETKNICTRYNIKPARSRGQNFLVKEEIYDKIIAAANLDKNDTVLEVGPGLGFLTEKLAQKVKKVIAVELDDKIFEILKISLKANGIKNVITVNDDILKFGICNLKFGNANSNYQLPITNYKIVANLPYNITSIFLRKFLSAGQRTGRDSGPYARDKIETRTHRPALRPLSMVLMLQKEVAERIVARPGKMSLLAVSVQFYGRPEIVEYAPKEYFWPEPQVDSAIIKINVGAMRALPAKSEKAFFRLVKFGFSSKRKMLKNNLAAGLHIPQTEAENKLKNIGFKEKIRAQELAVEDWIKLFGTFRQFML